MSRLRQHAGHWPGGREWPIECDVITARCPHGGSPADPRPRQPRLSRPRRPGAAVIPMISRRRSFPRTRVLIRKSPHRDRSGTGAGLWKLEDRRGGGLRCLGLCRDGNRCDPLASSHRQRQRCPCGRSSRIGSNLPAEQRLARSALRPTWPREWRDPIRDRPIPAPSSAATIPSSSKQTQGIRTVRLSLRLDSQAAGPRPRVLLSLRPRPESLAAPDRSCVQNQDRGHRQSQQRPR